MPAWSKITVCPSISLGVSAIASIPRDLHIRRLGGIVKVIDLMAFLSSWPNGRPALHTDPPRYYAFSNYEHRLFHIWNAFEPTGMLWESSSEYWVSEGMNTYYNSKALVELGFAKKGKILISEYKWYLQEIVGTKYDVPLTEAYKYGNWQEFNQYVWLGYKKGALVSYLLDAEIQKLTNGLKSLDDLQKLMYELYGAHRGCYSTKDVQKHLESLVSQSLQSFFENYVYGTTKLPLSLEGDYLVVKL